MAITHQLVIRNLSREVAFETLLGVLASHKYEVINILRPTQITARRGSKWQASLIGTTSEGYRKLHVHLAHRDQSVRVSFTVNFSWLAMGVKWNSADSDLKELFVDAEEALHEVLPPVDESQMSPVRNQYDRRRNIDYRT